jgi:predicted HTH domain antitoxin
MAQLSPQKRKKRRVQLREAQRRRRARLKEESKSFLQIILSQEMLVALRHYSDLVGKPLHACAAELIERGLDRPQQHDSQQQNQQQHVPLPEELPGYDGELSHSSESDRSEKSEEENKLSAGQMELFAG